MSNSNDSEKDFIEQIINNHGAEKDILILPFSEGEIFKNYPTLCETLNEKVRSGTAKKAQLKRWGKYFKWEKQGHKFIITEIKNERFPANDTNDRRGADIVERKDFCQISDRCILDECFKEKFNKCFQEDSYIPPIFTEWQLRQLRYLILGYNLAVSLRTSLSLYSAFQKLLNSSEKDNKFYDNYYEYVEQTLDSVPIHVKFEALDNNDYYIYRFLNNKDEIIYVGKTTRVKERMYHHFHEGHLPSRVYKETTDIEYTYFKTRHMMDMAEIYFITKFSPQYNTTQNYKEELNMIQEFEKCVWYSIQDTFLNYDAE